MLGLLLLLLQPAQGARAKDVGNFYGVEENQITGAGLIIGLARTGDTRRNESAIRQLSAVLRGQGIFIDLDEISSRNIATVMVTASVPGSSRGGAEIDITVASTGDATSLEGGQLLMTHLYGLDGEVHAVAQGSITVGGFNFQAAGNLARKGVPTKGHVVGGATLIREFPSPDYSESEELEFVLDDPDFQSAMALADAANLFFGAEIAEPTSASTVVVQVPVPFQGRFARFAAAFEAVEFEVDAPARVVVDERTGTVVMGAAVEIAPVAVAHGALSIEVVRTNSTVPQAPFAIGAPPIVRNSTLRINEADGQLVEVSGATIGDLVASLNAMGVKPRDLITILKAMHTAGAIRAELVTQ